MLSVCIPVYNTDVRQLARQLADQALKTDKNIELIFFDDCSELKFRELNREIQSVEGVLYQELTHNLGRATIRNLMGNVASQPWLLFMDADTEVRNPDFFRNYIQYTALNSVICGGVVLQNDPPEDKTFLLRWTYGKKREQLSAQQRIRGNKFALVTTNFLINKEVFLQHGFRENIKDYGHEDTVLGYDLIKSGIRILHIDNPVLHKCPDTSLGYLQKSRKALDNLLYISQHIIPDPEFRKELRMLRVRDKLSVSGLLPLTSRLFRRFESLLVRNLTGTHPNLRLFDLYRIGYLCQLSGNAVSNCVQS
jgi:glycosyltransferase involved in cell wall biosynthesis